MQTVATDKTAFDKPYDPISSAGMQRHAVDFEEKVNDILNGEQSIDRILFSDATELTIASGALSAPSLAIHTVAAQSGTSDDLDTIGASNNRFVFLKAKATHSIVVKHGIGNITTPGGIDVLLTGNRMMMLVCQGGEWGAIGNNTPINNLSATADPGGSADGLAGYSVGSLWMNTTLDRAWECVDASSGAAIWKLISPWQNGYEMRYWSVGGNLNITPIGLSGFTNNPDITSNPASNDSTNTWVDWPTQTSSGDRAGHEDATAAVRPAYNPVIEVNVKTSADLSSQRWWIGIASTRPNNADALTAATRFIGFRYANGTDTGWTPILNDGTTQNTGATIGTVATNTAYKLKLRVDANLTTAYLSVNDGAETVLSTNFPAIATDMQFYMLIYTNTAASRKMLVSSWSVSW